MPSSPRGRARRPRTCPSSRGPWSTPRGTSRIPANGAWRSTASPARRSSATSSAWPTAYSADAARAAMQVPAPLVRDQRLIAIITASNNLADAFLREGKVIDQATFRDMEDDDEPAAPLPKLDRPTMIKRASWSGPARPSSPIGSPTRPSAARCSIASSTTSPTAARRSSTSSRVAATRCTRARMPRPGPSNPPPTESWSTRRRPAWGGSSQDRGLRGG